MSRLIKYTACIAVPLFLISGCGGGSNDSSDTPKTVAVAFEAQVNGVPYDCGVPVSGVGSNGNEYVINDFRLFIHDFYINDTITNTRYDIALDQDGIWQQDNLALLDFEDNCNSAATPDTNSLIFGSLDTPDTVDLADTQLCFTVGVPADKNHVDSNTAASPLNSSINMTWNWRDGYKFIRIDGFGDPNGTNQGFNIHLGSQGCGTTTNTQAPLSACTFPNTIEVCLDNYDITNDKVVIDPAPILAASDISLTLGGTNNKPGCMSFVGDEDCIEIMPRLGLDYSYGNVPNNNPTYSGTQLMFKKSP